MDIKQEHTNLCRLCASSANFCNQSKNDLFHIDNVEILQQVKELSGLRLENVPELPRYFCDKCKTNLSHAYDFRKRLIEVHRYFKKICKQDFLKQQTDWMPIATFDTVLIPENDVDKLEDNSHTNEDIFDSNVDVLNDCVLNYEQLNEKECKLKGESAERQLKTQSPNENGVSKDGPKQNETNLEESSAMEQHSTNNDIKKLRKYKFKRKRSKTIIDESNENSFICEQCGLSFKAIKLLEIHAVRHEEKKFQCDLCPAKFFLPTELKRHKFSHTGEKPIACRYCSTKFLNKSNRNRHEKSQHLNVRPYVCDLCGKAFAKNCLKKNHMLVHTKERAFDCKLCQKSFLRKIHLVTHYKSAAHKKNEMESENLNT